MRRKCKLLKVALCCLGIFIPEICFAVNPSDNIVDNAKALIGAPYTRCTLYNDFDVLCLGSGGLIEIESSPILRKKLSDFLEQGGTLITLAAQNGYEFAALPGGNVTGYGWTEDQSCLNNAVSMVNYHQMLSGQSSTRDAHNACLRTNIPTGRRWGESSGGVMGFYTFIPVYMNLEALC